VYQLLHRGIRAAHRALRILRKLQFAKTHRQRIHEQQPTDQWLAGTEYELDDLRRLDDAQQARQHAEHSALGARWHQTGRRRLRIKTPVEGPRRIREYRCLPFKAKNRGVNIDLACQHAGVIDEITRGEVVGAVGNDVEVAEDVEGVRAGEFGVELSYVDEWIESPNAFRGTIDLRLADIAGCEQHLPLQVGFIDDVEVNNAKSSNSSGGQIERDRGAKASRADAEHARGLQPLLPCGANLRHDEMPRISPHLIGAERRVEDRVRHAYPPAMAPTMRNGSTPLTT